MKKTNADFSSSVFQTSRFDNMEVQGFKTTKNK